MSYRRSSRVFLALVVVLGLSHAALAQPVDVVQGQFGPGALYRLVRPANWNGSLLIYAHGYVGNEQPVALPAEADLFVSLLAPQGYALAYSSYSENGWAVKDGAQRTHQLLGIFKSKFGAPARVYVGGASMGGLIAIKLVEDYPNVYSGALAACAVSGGARAQYDYLANVRAMFDVQYPGVLPGDAGNVAPDVDLISGITLPASAAMLANGGGALALASISQTPVPFSSAAQLGESIVTALVGHARAFRELTTKMPNSRFFDNQDTTYTSPVLPAPVLTGINAAVDRFSASPSALNYLEHYYRPTGELTIPMLMLSTSLDPVAPGFHRTLYAGAVAAAGQSDLLVQRTINRYGHCTFTPGEIATALNDLILWVQFGIKPTP